MPHLFVAGLPSSSRCRPSFASMHRASSPRPTGADPELSSRLSPLLDRALSRARATGRGVLVTAAERIQAMDPLDVIDDDAELQTYWAVPREDVAIVGLGAVAVFGGSGRSRFSEVSDGWSRLREDAVVEEMHSPFVAGPMLMGGFSFDPDGPSTDQWNGFAAASFVVPQALV